MPSARHSLIRYIPIYLLVGVKNISLDKEDRLGYRSIKVQIIPKDHYVYPFLLFFFLFYFTSNFRSRFTKPPMCVLIGMIRIN